MLSLLVEAFVLVSNIVVFILCFALEVIGFVY